MCLVVNELKLIKRLKQTCYRGCIGKINLNEVKYNKL